MAAFVERNSLKDSEELCNLVLNTLSSVLLLSRHDSKYSPLVYHVGGVVYRLDRYGAAECKLKKKYIRKTHIKMEYLHTICTVNVRCQEVNMPGKLLIPS